jgi:geranylgeranyl diphosphate synthase type II
MQLADASQRQALDRLIAGDGPDKVDAMLDLYRATGADRSCLDAVNHYSDLAFRCLEEIAVISNRKKPLFELASYLLQRKS